MASISKSVAYDVGKFGDPSKPGKSTYKGERRGDKRPRGVVERFVDLQGNVVTAQLVGPGIPATPEAVSCARANLHAAKSTDGVIQGFVEHGKCPLRHGTRHRNELIEQEFAAMPADLQRPCSEDPALPRRTKDASGVTIHYGDGCPHIEWLIQSRRNRETERLKSRNIARESAMDIERKKLAATEAMAAEQKRTNEKLLEALTTKPRRGAE